jgi:hypothetical protein
MKIVLLCIFYCSAMPLIAYFVTGGLEDPEHQRMVYYKISGAVALTVAYLISELIMGE